ncbi:MAG: hypothetical protein JWQ42_428 [Edaphobacter sp.]|nr:hypothetical protein [Edaphobacter sp.]
MFLSVALLAINCLLLFEYGKRMSRTRKNAARLAAEIGLDSADHSHPSA